MKDEAISVEARSERRANLVIAIAAAVALATGFGLVLEHPAHAGLGLSVATTPTIETPRAGDGATDPSVPSAAEALKRASWPTEDLPSTF